jgi:hypothetical protein
MSKKMKLNGKEYDVPELNFSAVCAMEDWGLSLDDMEGHPLKFMFRTR